MRLIDLCTLRDVRDKKVLLVFGNGDSRFLEVNESFALLWERLQERSFTEEDVVGILMETYGLDETSARKEAADVVTLWQQHHLLQ